MHRRPSTGPHGASPSARRVLPCRSGWQGGAGAGWCPACLKGLSLAFPPTDPPVPVKGSSTHGAMCPTDIARTTVPAIHSARTLTTDADQVGKSRPPATGWPPSGTATQRSEPAPDLRVKLLVTQKSGRQVRGRQSRKCAARNLPDRFSPTQPHLERTPRGRGVGVPAMLKGSRHAELWRHRSEGGNLER